MELFLQWVELRILTSRCPAMVDLPLYDPSVHVRFHLWLKTDKCPLIPRTLRYLGDTSSIFAKSTEPTIRVHAKVRLSALITPDEN